MTDTLNQTTTQPTREEIKASFRYCHGTMEDGSRCELPPVWHLSDDSDEWYCHECLVFTGLMAFEADFILDIWRNIQAALDKMKSMGVPLPQLPIREIILQDAPKSTYPVSDY